MANLKLGVLGGTFDPPHLAHLVLAEHAREQLDLTRVLWVPAGDPWRKSQRSVTPGAHRLAMVRLAVAGHPGFEISTLELERTGPTYSVDTLAALQRQYPDHDLVFLLGEDALEDLPNWHQPERLVQVATLAVAHRGGKRPVLERLERLERLLPGLSGRVHWVEMPRLDISATALRERVAAGRSVRYLVPDAVVTYIRERGLYRPV